MNTGGSEMDRPQLLERILFAVDGYRFGEWTILDAADRITRLIHDNPEAAL